MIRETVRHYLPKYDLTVCWPKNCRSMETVIEFRTWKGPVDLNGSTLIKRRCVLMEPVHDAILTVCELIEKGDERTLKALMLTIYRPEGTTGILGDRKSVV